MVWYTKKPAMTKTQQVAHALLLLTLLLPVPLRAEEPAVPAPEAAPVREVKAVEVQGNHLIATATILAKVKTRPGNPFSQEGLDEDIRRLYATGFFVDVATELRDYQRGALVRFLLKERPGISDIPIAGNTAIREPAIRKVLSSKESEMLDRRTLKDDLDAIERLYREKGFQLAEVAHEVKVDEATNKAQVYLTIIEGKKVVVRDIRFEGNQAFTDRRLRKLMATRRGGFFIPGYYREEVLEDDLEKLRDFYRKAGYSDIVVEKAVAFDAARRSLTVTITLQEGRQYLVGDIRIEGNTQIPEQDLRQRLTLTTDAPFSQETLRADAANLQTAYFALGYMTNRVEPNTVLNPATGRVDITYTVTEGGGTHVEEVVIQGNTKTKDAVIRREIRVAPGSDPGRRNLVVNVKEAKTGEFSFGGGFSSVDRLLGFVEITQRNFDLLNWPTFIGGGQELRLRGTTVTRRRDLLMSFTEPWIFGTPYLFGVDAYDRVRDRGDGYSYEVGRRGGNLRTGHALSEYNRWDAVYRLERGALQNVPDNASTDLRAETGRKTVSSLRLQFARDTRDNRFSPKQGYWAFVAGEYAGSVLGGDRDFLKLTAGGSRYYEPLKDHVLELTANAGVADSFGDSNAVPIFERFFAGGADTIRGYKERRVGPKDRLSHEI